MIEKILVDNLNETVTVKWDEERFALVRKRGTKGSKLTDTIILNPREMLDLIEFAGKLGGN